MIRLFSAVALIVIASTTVLVFPASQAQAKSPSCDKAVSMVNAAVKMSGGNLGDEIQRKLADRLRILADVAGGEEKAAIAGYANALVDPGVSDLGPATRELNRVCGG